MKKIQLLAMLVLIAGGMSSTLLYAGGPANKVTGDFTRGNAEGAEWYSMLSAHQEKDGRPQKGFMMGISEPNMMWMVDLKDENSCVIVENADSAILGGPVSEQENLGLEFVGFHVVDGGEPGAEVDLIDVYVMTTEEGACFCDPEGEGCDQVALPEPIPYWITDGNLQVHYRD